MLSKTNYTVDPYLLQEAIKSFSSTDFKTTLNRPTGNFFYDPWETKTELMGTVWDKLLLSIKEPIGEARLIVLKPQMSYHAHADIDDRWHLNLQGEFSYLIDLEFNKIHKLNSDGIWYEMDAGRLHTASNFGRFDRIQLVVRKLLTRSKQEDLVHVRLLSNIPTLDDSRFMFDNKISKWLNTCNSNGKLNNFTHSPTCVEFDIDESLIKELQFICGDDFKVEL